MNTPKRPPIIYLKTSRIEALSDGIFAIAMTIIILSFEILLKPPGISSEKILLDMLLALWPDFLHYVQSFLILGAFWIQHHNQFHFIKCVDSKLILINIIGLMLVSIIPFTTVIVGDYSGSRIAAFLFEINLMLAGLVFYAQWAYASHSRRLIDPDMGSSAIRFYKKRNLIIPLISLVSIIYSIFDPHKGTLLYFIAPVIYLLYQRKK